MKRYETYNGDFVKAFEDYGDFCNCYTCDECVEGKCPLNKLANDLETSCFPVWLMVELDDEENINEGE